MGWWMVGGELGRTLGPIVIVTALQFLTLGTTPVLMVAGFAMSFLLFILLRDMVGRPARAIDALPWRRAVRAMVPILPLLLSIIVVRAFMLSALTTYLPTFLSQEGSGLFFAGAALSILQGAGVVGALVGGSLSDRFGRRTLLIISLVSTPLMMFAFLAVSGWIRLVLLVAMGLTGLSTTPVIMAAVQESLPDNRALANGTYMGLSFLIRALVIVLLGAIADLSSLRIAFATSAVVCLLGGPVAFLVPKGASGLRLADQPR
jgi:FSR family fosmidomycin resistance protein-like MFS transporter